MSAKKVLFITQEITPYVPESELSLIGQNLPQAIQDKGWEIPPRGTFQDRPENQTGLRTWGDRGWI